MKTRREAIDYCLSLGTAYEDTPFRDKNWTVVRHMKTNKVFAIKQSYLLTKKK